VSRGALELEDCAPERFRELRDRGRRLLDSRASVGSEDDARYREDPVEWAREVLGVHLWSRQQEIPESVRDHRATAVRSGHGVGKTIAAAVTAMWFLDTFPSSRVLTTATTWSQVSQLLWHDIRVLHMRARSRWQAQRRPIFQRAPLQTQLRLRDGRYAIGLASKAENSESFAGHHAPNLLVIYDEASGVHPAIFEVGEGYMTTEGARKLLIGNPTRPAGEFYDAFHSKRAHYNRIHISALESPAITGEEVPEDLRAALPSAVSIEEHRALWGEDSPLYQVRVLGNFAEMAEDAVIGLAAVEAAQQRELKPEGETTVACDVARFGDDETVIVTRIGPVVRIREHYYGKPTTHTAGRVAAVARELGPDTRIVIDDAGVGGGVTDQLRAEGFDVVAFQAGGAAHRTKDFPNRRSEIWFEAAAQLEDIDLDGDEQLAADLIAPRYTYDLKLRRVVEKKEETKKALGRSPDRADAVLLALCGDQPGDLIAPPANRRVPERLLQAPNTTPGSLSPRQRRLHERNFRR
jgi:phage terminase large subunit